MKEKKLELSVDFALAVQIYEDTVVKNELAYAQKLADEMGLDKAIVDGSLVKLWFDYHYLDSEEGDVDGFKVLCFKLNHRSLSYIKGVYNVAKSNDESRDAIDNIELLPAKTR